MTVAEQIAIIQAKLREHTMGRPVPTERVNDPVWFTLPTVTSHDQAAPARSENPALPEVGRAGLGV